MYRIYVRMTIRVHAPVATKDGLRTCSIVRNEYEPFLVRSPSAYWDHATETLQPVHEDGIRWLKDICTIEIEVLRHIDHSRWDASRCSTLFDLRRMFRSSVTDDGKRLRVTWDSNDSPFSTVRGCVHAVLCLERFVMDPHRGYYTVWSVKRVEPIMEDLSCLFEEDECVLHEVEWAS